MAPTPPQPVFWDQLKSKVALIEIIVETPLSVTGGHATGTVIYSDSRVTFILTCGHVVADYFQPGCTVSYNVSVDGETQNAAVISSKLHADQEIGILFVTRFRRQKNTIQFSSVSHPPSLYTLYMCSFAYFESRRLHSQGAVCSLDLPGFKIGVNVPNMLEHTVDGGPGASGAALVDENGKLVAIYTGAVLDKCEVKPVICDYLVKHPDTFVPNYDVQSPGTIKLAVPVPIALTAIREIYERLTGASTSTNATNVGYVLEKIADALIALRTRH